MDSKIGDQINACHANSPNGSAQGNALMHAIAAKTEALKPALFYVPWAVANNVHTDTINNDVINDLLGYVCDNFTGEKATACDERHQHKKVENQQPSHQQHHLKKKIVDYVNEF